jgi:hypothetical protein
MRCEYTVTYKDFADSLPAYRKVSRQARFGYWFSVWILPSAGLALAVLYLPKIFQTPSQSFGAEYWLGCLGLGVMFGFPARYRMGIRRAFKQRDALVQGRPMHCEFDDTTVRFRVPGGTEIAYPWEAFTDFYENERVAVLLVKESAFHTIPKNAMDESGWATFRSILHHHAGIRTC